MNPLSLAILSAPLEWLIPPHTFETNAHDTLNIVAAAESDWFFDPAGQVHKNDAPACLFAPSAPSFTLQARVTVEFASAFDAGVLFVYADETHWAKFCFEFSPHAQPMIVSVVTRNVSDDCNSVVMPENSVYLRVYHHENIWAFHYSQDGVFWNLARYFSLGENKNARVGFSAQSPTGKGCGVEFSQIEFHARTLPDLRNGA